MSASSNSLARSLHGTAFEQDEFSFDWLGAAIATVAADNGAAPATSGVSDAVAADSVWYSDDPNFVPLEPADFVTSGGKWGSSGTFGTSGGTVTWSIAGAGLTNQTGQTFFTGNTVALSSFLPADYISQISSAFDAWSQVANIQFVQVADGGGNFGVGTTAQIRIGGGFIDGFNSNGSVVGRAFFPPTGGNSSAVATNGDLVFDSGDAGHWNDALLYATALHEIGHTLGLNHSPQDNPTAVMNPTLHLGLPLQPDDIAGIQTIYGAPPTSFVPKFAPAHLVLSEFGAGAGGWLNQETYPRELADVNGDGRADIVGFGGAGIIVSLATGNGQFGASFFDSAQFGATPNAGGWVSQDVYHREVADVNADGRADIVGFGSAGTYVALATGGGHFATATFEGAQFGAGSSAGGWVSDNAYHRELADVNADGRADIVAFGSAGLYVALATGGGHFAAATFEGAQFGASSSAGGWSSEDLYHRELADVNGDGRADIVGFGSAGTYVALATGAGHFAATTFEGAQFGVANSAGGWVSDNLFHRELADVNGDGLADIVGFGSGGTYVALATGGGHFASMALSSTEFGTSGSAGGWTSEDQFPRELADVSGDHRADIVGFGSSGVYTSLSNFLIS